MSFMNFDSYSSVFENAEWGFVLDISSIWNKYSNGSMKITDFCNSYKDYILSNKDAIISKFGNDSWAKLYIPVQKLSSVVDVKEANAVFDDIYDWADSNEVLIKTNTQNEIF